jgi:hypothetical protein
MSRNRKPRESMKQHKRAARLRAAEASRAEPSGDRSVSAANVAALIDAAAFAAHGPTADEARLDHIVDALSTAATDGRVDLDAALTAPLIKSVAVSYESGWQPADVVHVVQHMASGRVSHLLREVVAAEAVASRAAERAPKDWLDQLTVVTARTDGTSAGDVSMVADWRQRERLTIADCCYAALTLLGVLRQLPRLTPIAPQPSQWDLRRSTARPTPRPSVRPPDASPDGEVPHARTLAKIRALLAKAEGSTFEPEAEAFTAKAQDLMTRHAIDAAMLMAANDTDLRYGVVARRVHLANPYASEKVDLLAVVCSANDIRTVWHQGLWFATVVGLPIDLEIADLLFTSLLVQVNRAMTAPTHDAARSRARGYRRAFMTAYAQRIGERLTEASQRANAEAANTYGEALVPVLDARKAAVEAEFARLFPSTRASRARRFDADGWLAGRAAADQADLRTARGRLGD